MSDLQDLVTVAEQRDWLAAAPADTIGRGARPDRCRQRVSGRARFDRLAADPRFDPLIAPVRRYLARTMPFPRRTELSRWSISALPGTNQNTWPRLFTVTVHFLETLYAYAPVDEQHRTLFALNVDADLPWERLTEQFPAVHARPARPGVLHLEVEGARNLMRLLDADGVVAAARRLNLELMNSGPSMQQRHHSFDLADCLLEPVTEPAGEPLRLGLYFDALGDVPRAEDRYRRAAFAGDAEAAFRLGELHSERGDTGGAESWYRLARDGGYAGVRRHPLAAATHALQQRGHDAWEDGDPETAARQFLLAAEAGATQAYLSAGDVLAERGRPDQAGDAYRRAARCGYPGGWFGLGVLLDEDRRHGEAQNCYRRAAVMGHPAAMYELGWAHECRGELGAAEGWYRRAVRAGHVDALVQLGDLLARRGDTGAAASSYRRAVKAGSGAGLVRVGLLHERDGEYDDAEACYRRAVERGHTQAWNELGHLYAERGEHARAAGCYREAADAGHYEGHLYLGDLHDEQGRHDAAEQCYRLAAAQGDEVAVTRLGGHFLDLGELDAAEPLLRAAARRDPEARHLLDVLMQERSRLATPAAERKAAVR
ncbi:tetratricopeptide repeat protein [Actinoplanes sp. NPDC051861]|uniref:tetratricopeptide repeat protein n=1 Tax=Actinoplanes sp. NPDC051861 TaxID=3155170 RepID=UPI0034188DA7